jgi:hypothetical protein
MKIIKPVAPAEREQGFSLLSTTLRIARSGATSNPPISYSHPNSNGDSNHEKIIVYFSNKRNKLSYQKKVLHLSYIDINPDGTT